MEAESAFLFDRAVILGATGPTGVHLANVLRKQGTRLRLVSRSKANLERRFGSEHGELLDADALDPGQTARSVEGWPVVFDCIGLPGELIHQHPAAARNIAEAARKTGVRCVQISSFWSYLPLQRLPVNEDHPRTGGGDWVKHRREAEDILQEAGAAILHLPDFYGPEVHTSTLQRALQDAAAGKAASWIGPADIEREYIFVPGAMEIAARAARRERAYGERWILPGAGPLTGRRAAEIASSRLGRRVKLRTAGPGLLRVLSLFNRDLRGFMQLVPEYVKPVRYDASKLAGLLGGLPSTSYDEGIGQTLDWLTGPR